MQNSNEQIVNQFEVEELETRLENKWGKPKEPDPFDWDGFE